MSEIAVREQPTSDLAITADQTFWNDKQRAALHQLGVGSASDADLAVFFHQSVRTGLDPFARQIYLIERWSKDGPKQTIQTGIDGFRLIARRATDSRNGTLGYEPTEWCGPDGQWRDVWLEQGPPAAARVTVIRDGARFPAVALYSEYVQTKKDKSPTQMWATKGALMLAKCAEALALRKAFPQDLSGLYTGDEMGQADNPPAQMEQPAPPPTEAPVGITDDQRKALHTLASELGLTREQKLAGVAATIGREVESTNALSKGEASKVIDSLAAAVESREPAQDADADGVVDGEIVEPTLPESEGDQ